MPKRTMTKRFYVSSPKMSDGTAERNGWLRTLDDAIKEAKRRITQEYAHLDEIYVVEIIRVVRRADTPVIVEEVR